MSLFLPSVEIFWIYMCAGLEVIYAFQKWNVHQDAACDYPSLEIDNRVLNHSSRGDFSLRVTVIHLIVKKVMAKRIQVRVAMCEVRNGIAGNGRVQLHLK